MLVQKFKLKIYLLIPKELLYKVCVCVCVCMYVVLKKKKGICYIREALNILKRSFFKRYDNLKR